MVVEHAASFSTADGKNCASGRTTPCPEYLPFISRLNNEAMVSGQTVLVGIDDPISQVVPVALALTFVLPVLARPYPIESLFRHVELSAGRGDVQNRLHR